MPKRIPSLVSPTNTKSVATTGRAGSELPQKVSAQDRTERMRKRRDLEDPVMAKWNAVAAANLRRLRLETGLTVAALAGRIGVSVPLVQQHENGRSRMNAGQVKVYADTLGVGVGEFYTGRCV